jgi:quercetin dioxygenase-like cupin family protein
VAENSQVRVLRITYGPHERSAMHWHPNAVAVFVTDSHFKFTMADGSSQERRGKAGDAVWIPAEKHLPENLGDHEAKVILVELKHATGAAPAKKKKK